MVASNTKLGEQPLVTVLVPTYNRASYLKQSIDSILNQTYQNLEVLVLDNASSDNTEEVIASYDDSRIIYVKNAQNLGIIGNHNLGFRLARGEFIHLFSDDDLMSDNSNLEVKVNIMLQHPSVGVVHSSIITIDSKGEIIAGNWAESLADWPSISSTDLMSGEEAFKFLYYKWNFVNMPAALIRKKVLSEYKLEFNNQLRFLLDWGLWLQIALFSDYYYIDKPMISYRVHQKNITKSMLDDSYYTELVVIKIGLLSLFPESLVQIPKSLLEIDLTTRQQLGHPLPGSWLRSKRMILSRVVSKIRRILPK